MVEVEYGVDIYCIIYGFGFLIIEKNFIDFYLIDFWNLNFLFLYLESFFCYIKFDIFGMIVLWVYVGMIFFIFCWYNEDYYVYLVNYQYFGVIKIWYGIFGDDVEKFENVMREVVLEFFEMQLDFLFQFVIFLILDQLKKVGV